MLPQKIVFVDLETTGGSLKGDRVVEVGVVKVVEGKVVKTFNSLLDPNCYFPPEIQRLTGISTADLEGAPSFYQISDELFDILDDAVFVAHNVRFDYSFLKNEFRRLNVNFAPKHFCTVKLSRTLFPQYRHHNLDSIMERFNFECERRHRALDDAKLLWDFYQKIQEIFSEEEIEKAINLGLKKPTVPINLDLEVLNNLPEKSGVYIFYGQSGAPLYVGKSINIRKRVLSHFSSDHVSSTEMKIAQQICDIETIKTNGELGALILEAELVKKLQPLYNRKLRMSHNMVVIKKRINKDGFCEAIFEGIQSLKLEEIGEVLAVAKSIKRAKEFLVKLSKDNQLCPKLLNLEKTKGACFDYRLGKCNGACISKEKPVDFNLRFDQSFQKTKFQQWPFSQPVVIEEVDEELGSREVFLIENWCCIAKAKIEEDCKNLELLETNFDLDNYRILQSYLRSPRAHGIKTISLETFQNQFNQ